MFTRFMASSIPDHSDVTPNLIIDHVTRDTLPITRVSADLGLRKIAGKRHTTGRDAACRISKPWASGLFLEHFGSAPLACSAISDAIDPEQTCAGHSLAG